MELSIRFGAHKEQKKPYAVKRYYYNYGNNMDFSHDLFIKKGKKVKKSLAFLGNRF
jgi:hypothetical protein